MMDQPSVPKNMTQSGEMYLMLLSIEESDLIKQVLATLKTGNGGSVKEQEALVQLLRKRPYPLLQILNYYRDKSRYQIGKIIAKALLQFIEIKHNNFGLNFVSFLANFPLDILEAASLHNKLLGFLGIPSLSDEPYLALLSRKEFKLLDDVLATLSKEYWSICTSGVPSKEFVLEQALSNTNNFVPLLSCDLKQCQNIPDIAIRNNLLILKVLRDLQQQSKPLIELEIAKCMEVFKLAESPPDLQEIHTFFYADFQRFCVILDFLRQHEEAYKTKTVGALLKANGVLQLLYESNIETSFDETRQVIESLHKWQRKMPATRSIKELELQTLAYYSTLSTVYDIILEDGDLGLTLEAYYASKLQQLNGIIRQIRNFDVLCSLLEDIFQLVFLRWEQLEKGNTRHGNSYNSGGPQRSTRSSSCSDSTDLDNGFETPAPQVLAHHSSRVNGRHGFICRGRALKSLFSFLKKFVTKKVHTEDYKLASECERLRFQRIVEAIGEALWKYAVLEKIDDSLSRVGGQQKFQLEDEELLLLVRAHIPSIEKSSSDDDSRDRFNYTSLTRRKSTKKRRRATFSGGTRPKTGVFDRSKGVNLMVTSVSVVEDVATTDPVREIRARNMVTRLTDRSIIPKMLGTPENLAIMALALKNFDDVKYIIETFNLKNSELNRELHFVEQQQQVKEKLSLFYANYKLQDQHENDPLKPLATVEQIKAVAAKGFEVSKFISVIDNFAQTHKLQQTSELKQLLAKHTNSNAQYSFLRHFEEHNLNAVIIADLVLNLSLNRDLTSNVLLVIKRQQNFNKSESNSTAKDTQPVKSQFPLDIGVLPFLENLCECMRLLKDKLSLSELLTNNYYSLKPHRLASELNREAAFNKVFLKPKAEIGNYRDLLTYTPYLQNLYGRYNYYVRFSSYVAHLTRLVKLRDQNLEMHIGELLKIDPCTVIGELIFECDMTPLEIEANVTALNLNLVHVIALNICPEIGGRCGKRACTTSRQRQKTIQNYIAQQNGLLACLLECIIDGRGFNETDEKLSPVFMRRYIELDEIEKLAALYDGNHVMAVLRSDNINMELLENLTKLKKIEIFRLEIGNQAYAAEHKREIDRTVIELIKEDAKSIHLAKYINNIALRARMIQKNFTRMATTLLAKELIESTLNHKDATLLIPADLRQQLEHTLADITIYAKVSEVLQFETWPQAYDFGLKTPNVIFQKLLRKHLYKLCYEWCVVVRLAERFVQFKRIILSTLLEALLELHDDDEMNTYLLHILETFPREDCIGFLDEHKDKFRSLLLLEYSIDFLVKYERSNADAADSMSKKYRNYQTSLEIFKQLTLLERDEFWHIFKNPLLIIEKLIMNAKFETLAKVLSAARKSINKTVNGSVCGYCYDKRGHIYDIHTKHSSSTNSPAHKIHFQIGNADNHTSSGSAHSAFMLLNFNLYQQDHYITHECIDLLLRIYATKALDYHVSEKYSSSSERVSQFTDMQQSLDSLCDAFVMPKTPPARAEWVKDEDATHCMCCRRAAFSLLMRRHHCRRCGRVVCFACSPHRMMIPEFYDNVEVRVCNDCQRILEENQRKHLRDCSANQEGTTTRISAYPKPQMDMFKWHLSGNITHDKLLREEFCYEHAPSVALCLSILSYHIDRKKCVELLLYHCRKLEKLFVPNPEVDYELVAKMMNCLALAAKVRGGPGEIDSIREHSDIVVSVVQNGCESLIQPGPLNNNSLRKLADALVQTENWSLALEVHLKWGFSTAGVMAAHGLACLRAGCFDTAREKLSHCMPKLTNENANTILLKFMLHPSDECSDQNAIDWLKNRDVPKIRRPQRGPPLLQEILKIIASTAIAKPQPETLQRASIIRNSNSSLASMLSRRKEVYSIPMHEPALNILTTLANLKRIANGDYGLPESNELHLEVSNNNVKNRSFEESLFYVLTYGSHADVIQFLMHHQFLNAAVRYFLIQQLDAELFIQNIYLVCLRCGEVPILIETMFRFDSRLSIWQQAVINTCRYLESHNLLNSLYQLQMLLKDPVRASMTCVKFYTMNCENFEQLHASSEHLHNAHKHLQTELELAQWENINVEQNKSATSFLANAFRSRKSSTSNRRLSNTSIGTSFLMQMDARSLNTHINTILVQLEVAKFLAKCERDNIKQGEKLVTLKILKQIRMDSTKAALPTLFDGSSEKLQICVLILYCGKNIEEGFGLAYRIIQDFKIPTMKVYGATAKYLARNHRLSEVERLLNCITSNNGTSNRDLDEILSIVINSAVNSHDPEVKTTLDNLIKKIHSVELRISSHIFIGQLKSAYLLANKHERLNDIRKILRQAELTKQIHIKRLCERKLSMTTSTASGNSETSEKGP